MNTNNEHESQPLNDWCYGCRLEHRFKILYLLTLFMGADSLSGQLEEFAERGLNDEELTIYELQTLDMGLEPEAWGAIRINDK